MPAVLKIDRQRRIVSSTFYGEIAGKDLMEHRERIRTDPEFDPNFAEVVDFSGVKMISVSESALMTLAATESLFSKDVPHVRISPADLPTTLALRYRDIVRETRPHMYVVRTLAEAQKLLRELGYGL
jgi:hypothetical protein